MRAPLLCAAFVLLCTLASISSALLSGSFVSTNYNNVTVQVDPFGGIDFSVNQMSVTFTNATQLQTSSTGYMIKQDGSASAIGPVICSYEYSFQLPGVMQFRLPGNVAGNSFCSEPLSDTIPACPWYCKGFVGQFIPFFAPPVAPFALSIGSDIEQSTKEVNWGNLATPLTFYCNTTSCGDTSGMFPPTPLPANVTFEVRSLLEYFRHVLCCVLIYVVLRMLM